MKRIVVTAVLVAALIAIGLWRDAVVPEGQFDALGFVLGMPIGVAIAFTWLDPVGRAFGTFMDWIDR